MLAHSYLYAIASWKDSNYNVVDLGVICSILMFFCSYEFFFALDAFINFAFT